MSVTAWCRMRRHGSFTRLQSWPRAPSTNAKREGCATKSPNLTCAESRPDNRQINALVRKLALHFGAGEDQALCSRAGKYCPARAHLLWQDDSETIEESGLCRVLLGHAAQANLAMHCGRQNDVLGLNAFEFFQDDARRITVVISGRHPAEVRAQAHANVSESGHLRAQPVGECLHHRLLCVVSAQPQEKD